jgi:RNA polymerase subunit RPABC4/transcription elongation factor Spt4
MTPVIPRQRVIPSGGWLAAGIVSAVFGLLTSFVVTLASDMPWPLKLIIPILIPLMLGGYTLLVGYVYGDARRRGMRYVMWTLLAIFLANGIGVILYFILRDPLLVYCPRCGAGVQPSHAFCPRCGAGVQPACRTCHRTVQTGWTHCAWCGTQLSA